MYFVYVRRENWWQDNASPKYREREPSECSQRPNTLSEYKVCVLASRRYTTNWKRERVYFSFYTENLSRITHSNDWMVTKLRCHTWKNTIIKEFELNFILKLRVFLKAFSMGIPLKLLFLNHIFCIFSYMKSLSVTLSSSRFQARTVGLNRVKLVWNVMIHYQG